MKICKDGRIWGQSNKEAGDHLGILTGRRYTYINKRKFKTDEEFKEWQQEHLSKVGKKSEFKKGHTKSKGSNNGMFGRKKEKNPNWQGGKTPKICSICGRQTAPRYSTLARVVCSQECKSELLRQINSKENCYLWKGGISKEPYSFDFNKELKELIRKRDNYKCQKCGAPQKEFSVKLPVHHMDYNKQNSSPKNLITLCVRCNVEVNGKREYWFSYFKQKVEIKENG